MKSTPDEGQSLLPRLELGGQHSPRSRQWATSILVAALVSWLAASSLITLTNKYIVKDLGFSYPLALSSLGQVVSYSGSWLMCSISTTQPSGPIDPWVYLTRIVPVGVGQGIGIWLSNKLYLYLTVSVIEMTRSAMPLMTLTAMWALGLQQVGQGQVIAVLAAGLGSCISSLAEINANRTGVLLLLLSMAIEVARMVMLQYLLQGLSLNAWQSVMMMSGPASISLICLTVLLEAKDIVTQQAGLIIRAYLPVFFLAGVLGLMVNYISSAIIQLSSATTIKLLAAVRGPIIVVSAMLLFAEQVTLLQLMGYSLAVVGFGSYQWLSAATPVMNTDRAGSNVTTLRSPQDSMYDMKVTIHRKAASNSNSKEAN